MGWSRLFHTGKYIDYFPIILNQYSPRNVSIFSCAIFHSWILALDWVVYLVVFSFWCMALVLDFGVMSDDINSGSSGGILERGGRGGGGGLVYDGMVVSFLLVTYSK